MRLSTMTYRHSRQGVFGRPFGDQFISPIFRHKSSATWPSDLKPGSRSLIFVEFVLLGFDLGAGRALCGCVDILETTTQPARLYSWRLKSVTQSGP